VDEPEIDSVIATDNEEHHHEIQNQPDVVIAIENEEHENLIQDEIHDQKSKETNLLNYDANALKEWSNFYVNDFLLDCSILLDEYQGKSIIIYFFDLFDIFRIHNIYHSPLELLIQFDNYLFYNALLSSLR
jgi:hypothetical protein